MSLPYTGFESSYGGEDPPNGAFGSWRYADPTGAPLAGNGNYVTGGVTVYYVGGIPVSTAAQAAYPLFLRVTVAEPIFMSPFLSGSAATRYEEGLVGVSNIQFQMQMQTPAAARILKQLSTNVISNVSFLSVNNSPFLDSAMLVNFILLPPLLPAPEKSVVPYTDITAYPFAATAPLGAAATATVRSNTISLPCVPDLLIVSIRPQTWGAANGDWFIAPDSISVSMDNASGLMSSVPKTHDAGQRLRNAVCAVERAGQHGGQWLRAWQRR